MIFSLKKDTRRKALSNQTASSLRKSKEGKQAVCFSVAGRKLLKTAMVTVYACFAVIVFCNISFANQVYSKKTLWQRQRCPLLQE